jgi:hypothetical protein
MGGRSSRDNFTRCSLALGFDHRFGIGKARLHILDGEAWVRGKQPRTPSPPVGVNMDREPVDALLIDVWKPIPEGVADHLAIPLGNMRLKETVGWEGGTVGLQALDRE